MNNKQNYSVPFYAYNEGSTLALATKAAATGAIHYISDITGYSSIANSILVAKDGSTTMWVTVLASDTPFAHSFVEPLKGTAGNAVTLECSGTTTAKVSVSGFTYTPSS